MTSFAASAMKSKLVNSFRKKGADGMSDQNRLEAEQLVPIYKARDEWEGNILVGYLQDNGVEATLQARVQNADAATHTGFGDTDASCGVYVMEEAAPRATALVQEFETAVTDPQILEEAAAEKLKLDKETITRLRGALKEETGTFEMLGWICVIFLAATAALWAVWPGMAQDVGARAGGALVCRGVVRLGGHLHRQLDQTSDVMKLACNIDQRGRRARLIGGIIADTGDTALLVAGS